MTVVNVNAMMEQLVNGKEVTPSMTIAHVIKSELVEEKEELMMSTDLKIFFYIQEEQMILKLFLVKFYYL